MEDSATFTITGSVTRVWVSESGKFAKVEITSQIGDKKRRTEMRAFSDMVPSIKALKPGQRVTIDGEVEKNALKDKGRNDVKVDNYTAWVHELTVRAVTAVRQNIRAPASTKPMNEIVGEGGDVPF